MQLCVLLLSVAGSQDETGLQSRSFRGVEFGDDIAEEQNFRRRGTDVRGDPRVTLRFALRANRRPWRDSAPDARYCAND